MDINSCLSPHTPCLHITLTSITTDDIGDQSQYNYSTTATGVGAFDWDINITDFLAIKKPAISQGIYELSSNYTLHDRSYDVELFKDDCLTAPSGLDSFPLVFSQGINNPSGDTNEITLKWIYNQTKIEMSDLWTANKTGGEVDFCIRVNNYLPGDGWDGAATSMDEHYREIHFLEIIYKIEVDSLTDFNTTIDIKRVNATDGGEDFINYEEDIQVYQCDDSFDEITNPPPLNQGDYLQLCVETVDDSRFGVHSIKELDVSQNADNGNLYAYVNGYLDSPLTETMCTDSNTTGAICKAKMQLLSAYFDVESNPYGPIDDLFANGTVKLDYVGRRLSVDVPINVNMKNGNVGVGSERRLEENNGDFGITVELAAGDDSSGNFNLQGLLSSAMAFFAGGMYIFA